MKIIFLFKMIQNKLKLIERGGGGACHLDLHAGKLWGFTLTINLSISNILSR